MAVGSHKARVDITANTTQAQKSTKAFRREIERLENELKQARKAQRGKTEAMVDFVAKAGLAVNTVQQTIAVVDRLSKQAMAYRAVQQNMTFSINEARESTRGLIGDMELMTAANQAAALGVAASSKEFAQMAKDVVTLGASLGRDATDSLNRFVLGVGKGEQELLDELGIIVKADDAYAKYAASVGVATSALNEQQKMAARREEAMKQLRVRVEDLDEAELGLAGRLQQSVKAVENIINKLLNLESVLGDLGERFNITLGPRGQEILEGFGKVARTNFAAATLGASEYLNALIGIDQYTSELTFGQQVADIANSGEARRSTATDREGMARQQREFQSQLEQRERERYDGLTEDEAIANSRELQYIEFLAEKEKERAEKAAKAAEAARKARERMWEELLSPSDPFMVEGAGGDFQRDLQQEQFDVEAGGVDARTQAAERELEALRAKKAEMSEVQAAELELLTIQREAAAWRSENALEESERVAARQEILAINHDRRMTQIQQEMEQQEQAAAREKQIQEDRMQTIQDVQKVYSVTSSGIVDVAGEAARASGASSEQIADQQRKLRSFQMYLDAAFYFAKGGAAALALNPIEAAANFAAGAFAVAKASFLASYSGGGASASSGGGGRAAPSFAGGGGLDRRTGGGDIPGSRGRDRPTAIGDAANSGPSVSIGNVQVLGAVDDTTSRKLLKGIQRVQQDRSVFG